MKILLALICIILFISVIILAVIVFRYQKRFKRNETQILKMLRQLRYGQLNINISTFKNENIKSASEKMLEALKDREIMLAEYKQLLLEKNKHLEEAIEKEKEAQKFKDDFVAALTHDLKTPVIAEINTLKMLLSGTFGEISDSQREVLEMMLKSENELKDLSEMLLLTYKYQQAEITLSKTKTDLKEFIRETFQELYPVLSPKNQKPVMNFSDGDIFAEIDHVHFKRVLHNLISNASKYGFSNTEIVIDTRAEDNCVKISVINDGETINEKDVELIFQKYYTGTNKFSYLGTGLGLYCVNKIVKAHGGEVKVETSDNKNIFTVILPSESGENE